MKQFVSGTTYILLIDIASVVTGLFAGYIQVVVYYALFSMAFISTSVPDSLLFGTIVRLAH